LAASLISIVFATAGAAAAEGRVQPFPLSIQGCAHLDGEEIKRLLYLELASVENVEDMPQLSIELFCDETNVIVIVFNPERTQKIERTVPAPKVQDEGAERQIALIIAQFAGALWRLREENPPPVVAPTTPEPPTPPPEPEPEAADQVRLDLEIGGGIRARALGSSKPLVGGYGEIDFVYRFSKRIALVAAIDVEGSSVDRLGGEVGALAITAGLGISGLLVIVHRFQLDARVLLLGGYARIEGRARDPEAFVDRVSAGGAGEARIEVAPTLLLGRTTIGLCLEGGYGLPVVVAEVRDDDDVSFGGWWVGGGVRIGFGIAI
jgi:hypothetical protein